MSKNPDVFNSRNENCLVFNKNKIKLFYTFYRPHAASHHLKREVLKI